MAAFSPPGMGWVVLASVWGKDLMFILVSPAGNFSGLAVVGCFRILRDPLSNLDLLFLGGVAEVDQGESRSDEEGWCKGGDGINHGFWRVRRLVSVLLQNADA